MPRFGSKTGRKSLAWEPSTFVESFSSESGGEQELESLRAMKKRVLAGTARAGRAAGESQGQIAADFKTRSDNFDEAIKQQEQEMRAETWPVRYMLDIPAGQATSLPFFLHERMNPTSVLFIFGTYSYKDAAETWHRGLRYCQEYIGEMSTTFSCLHREQ
jgi:hypothetical protein